MHEIPLAEVQLPRASGAKPSDSTDEGGYPVGASVGFDGLGYSIDAFLATGGTAQVYHAALMEDAGSPVPSSSPKAVVIKVMKAEYAAAPVARERFLREGELLCRLSHPNLVRGLALGQSGDLPFIVMEHIPGQTLAARIQQGPIEQADALRLATEVLSALNHLYLDGRVSAHRDIKPSNIMLTEGGTAKLIDLGVARTPLHIERPLDTGLLGTPLYLAPEQIDDAASADIRSDIFSLGAVLFEMLCGSRAFSGQGARQILAQRLSGTVPELPHTGQLANPQLWDMLNNLLEHAMAPNRLDRYQTPSEFLAAITLVQRSLKEDHLQQPPEQAHAACRQARTARKRQDSAMRSPDGVLRRPDEAEGHLGKASTRLAFLLIPIICVCVIAGLLVLAWAQNPQQPEQLQQVAQSPPIGTPIEPQSRTDALNSPTSQTGRPADASG